MRNAVPTYWFQSSNFGDRLAPYLVEKISGFQPVYVDPKAGVEHIALVGSILESCGSDSVVWGAGFCYEDSVSRLSPGKVHAVRGRLSQEIAGNANCMLGDPALLLPRIINPIHVKKYRVGIIPHVVDLMNVYRYYANKYPDFRIINLSNPVEQVIQEILECETTISSSLHGLVVSHAYGIPSRWVEFSDSVLGSGFKFRDYFTTVLTEPTPINLREFPDISQIYNEIPQHQINIDLDKLMEVCPIRSES